MESALIKLIIDRGWVYLVLPEESMEKVYRLYFEDVPYLPETELEFVYLGSYYRMQKKHAEMEAVFLVGFQRGYPVCQNELLIYYLKRNFDQAWAFFQAHPKTHLVCWSILTSVRDKITPDELVACCRICFSRLQDLWAPYVAINFTTSNEKFQWDCYQSLSNLPNYLEILVDFASTGEDKAYNFLMEYYFTRINWNQPDEFVVNTFLSYAQQRRTTTSFTFLGTYYIRIKQYDVAIPFLETAIQQGCNVASLNYSCLVVLDQSTDSEMIERGLRCLILWSLRGYLTSTGHLLDYYWKKKDRAEVKWWCRFILSKAYFTKSQAAQANFLLGQCYFDKGWSVRGLPYLDQAVRLGHGQALDWTHQKITETKTATLYAKIKYVEFSLRHRRFNLSQILLSDLCLPPEEEFKYTVQMPATALTSDQRLYKKKQLEQYQSDVYASLTYFTKWIVSDVKGIIFRYLDG